MRKIVLILILTCFASGCGGGSGSGSKSGDDTRSGQVMKRAMAKSGKDCAIVEALGGVDFRQITFDCNHPGDPDWNGDVAWGLGRSCAVGSVLAGNDPDSAMRGCTDDGTSLFGYGRYYSSYTDGVMAGVTYVMDHGTSGLTEGDGGYDPTSNDASGSNRRRSDQGSSPPPAESGTETAAPTSGHSGSTKTFTGTYFTVDYPSSWNVETAEASNGSYLDTTIRSTEQPSVMLRVDVTPGLGGDARSDAQPVVSALRRVTGYREIRLRRTTFGGYSALVWEFIVPERGMALHKIDVFFVDGSGNEFAVLTQAPTSAYGAWASIFSSLRDSLSVND
jgi:hypothetical protein